MAARCGEGNGKFSFRWHPIAEETEAMLPGIALIIAGFYELQCDRSSSMIWGFPMIALGVLLLVFSMADVVGSL